MFDIMKIACRQTMVAIAAVAVGATAGIVCAADSFNVADLPQGQMRIVVPYTPGGGSDILGRAIAQQIGDLYHRTVIVDNRSGANGTVGAAFVAQQKPDGATMLLVPAGYAANPALYKSLPYNQDKDLEPLSLLASGPLVLVVHPSLPVKSVKDLIALAKAKPNELNVGNAGIGSLPHLSGELFNSLAGVKLTSIPYKGAGAAQVDVLSGRVQVYFMNILQALPLIKGGQLRALGVTSPQASPIAPEIPPIANELPGFDMDSWYGMLVPAGTPPATVLALQKAIAVALNQPDVKQKLYNDGEIVVASTPEAFSKFLAKETTKYNKVIEAAGIKNSM